MAMPSVTVQELHDLREQGADIFVLDVREPYEAEIAALEGTHLVPLAQLPAQIDTIPRDQPVLVMCHHGGRSARAVEYLMAQGLTDVRNVTGGIHAWSLAVDPCVPRY